MAIAGKVVLVNLVEVFAATQLQYLSRQQLDLLHSRLLVEPSPFLTVLFSFHHSLPSFNVFVCLSPLTIRRQIGEQQPLRSL